MRGIGCMWYMPDIHPIPHMSPITDIGDKMGNWDKGDICEIHDNPDECDESCDMDELDIEDETDNVCRFHLFGGECDEACILGILDDEDLTV